jgi:ribonuclease HI
MGRAGLSPVIIYCDASLAHDLPGTPVGWGAVIVRGNAVHETSGTFERSAGEGSAWHELNASLLALRHALSTKIAKRGDTVFLASDCTTVESYVASPRRMKKPSPAYCAVGDRIRRLADRRGVVLIVCHVKGHQTNGSSCPHSAFNKRADALARFASGVRTDPDLWRGKLARTRLSC